MNPMFNIDEKVSYRRDVYGFTKRGFIKSGKPYRDKNGNRKIKWRWKWQGKYPYVGTKVTNGTIIAIGKCYEGEQSYVLLEEGTGELYHVYEYQLVEVKE